MQMASRSWSKLPQASGDMTDSWVYGRASRCSDGAERSEESTIDISKAWKPLYFLHQRGYWPVSNGLQLVVIHLHPLARYDIPKELDGGLVELEILQLEVKMVLSQFLKDLLHVVEMFGQVLGVNKDIVNIDSDGGTPRTPHS